jgi:hypothetical protein
MTNGPHLRAGPRHGRGPPSVGAGRGSEAWGSGDVPLQQRRRVVIGLAGARFRVAGRLLAWRLSLMTWRRG